MTRKAPRHQADPKVLRVTNRPGTARAVTAAAQKINITTRDGRKLIRGAEKWQEEAWAYFDVLPWVKAAAAFMGNALSRVRLFPGVIVDPDEPPAPLSDTTGTNLPKGLAAAADEELARINNGLDGMAGIMRGFGINLVIAGEAYLIGRPDADDPLFDEVWGIYSRSAVEVRGETTRIKETPKDRGAPLPDDALVYRIWRRNPQWPGLADANLRGALDACEELVIYGRVFRAIAKSAAHAGVLKMPQELDLPTGDRSLPADHADAPGPDPAAAGKGNDELTPLERDLIEALITPVENDDTAASVAPFMLRGAHQYLDAVEWIDIGRSIDQKALDRIDGLISQVAHGMDLPVEILKGLSDTNHWTSWQIEDQTYKAHVEPVAAVPAYGIAAAFLRPALLERGFSADAVRQVVLGLDPSALVVRPNRGEDTKYAYEAGEASGDELRAALNIPDGAEPDTEELLVRYVLKRGIGGVNLTGYLMRELGLAPDLPVDLLSAGSRGGGSSGDEDDDESSPSGDGGDAEDGGDPIPGTQPARALLAAVDPLNPFTELGEQLAAVESALMARLQVAASDDVTDALRVAGSRLRAAAQGDAELRQRINGLPPEDIGMTLGAQTVAALADPDWLLNGSFTRLGDRWDTWVAQAQADTAALLAGHTATAPDRLAVEAAIADYRARQDDDRSAGWVVLAGLLVAFTRHRLTTGAPEMVQGEHDPTTIVPAGVVRDALARVGGAEPGLLPAGSAQLSSVGGMSSSVRVRTVLDAMGATVRAFRWTVGAPAHPFEPHQSLAGVSFSDWDDQRLSNPAPWPPVPFFAPGDHQGCQCNAIPEIVPVSPRQQRQEVA